MKIVQDGQSQILRSTCKKVPTELFGTTKLNNIVKNMFESLVKEHDGVAIAAPQIDVDYQIFVVSPTLDISKNKKHLVYINPKIIRTSSETKYMDEGCLSVRWLYGQVKRHTRVSVLAYDQNGKKFECSASGLLAHIFQHEIDHLFGILFIDKAIKIVKLSDQDILELESKNERA